MADKEKDKKESKGELCHISISVAENGYKICCCYEPEKTLSQRAGWVPYDMGKPVEYVEKTKAAVIKQLESIL